MLPGADPSPDLQVGVNTSPRTGASFSSPQGMFFFFWLVKAFQAESSAQFRQAYGPQGCPIFAVLDLHRSFLQCPVPGSPLGLCRLGVRPLTGDSYLGLP